MFLNEVSDIQRVLKNLSHEDPDERRQAILKLGELKDKRWISRLINLFQDPVRAVQEAVVDALIQIRGREVVTALVPILAETNLTARNLALEVLKRIGGDALEVLFTGLREARDPFVKKTYCEILGAIGSSESISYLIPCLQSPQVLVAMGAAEALGQIGDPQAVPYLLQSLKGPTWVRCAVVEAIGKIGDLRALGPLIQIPFEENLMVTFMVIRTLGNLRDERCLPYLLSALKYHPRFVVPVIQALEKLSEKLGDEVYDKVREAKANWTDVIPLLRSHDVAIRRSAIRFLEKLRLREAVVPLIHLIEFEEEEELLERLVDALVAIGDQELEAIHRALSMETLRVRTILLEVLGRIGKEASVPILLQALEDSHEEVRLAAAKALGQIRSSVSVDPLIRRLQDGFGHVRRAAASSLGAIGDPRAFLSLVELLKDPYPDVRMAASEAIVKIQGLPSEEKIQWVQPLLKEDRDEVRVLTLQTLFHIAGEKLLPLYIQSLRDPSWKVREGAVRALSSLTNPEITTFLLPLLEDENSQVRVMVVKAIARFPGNQAMEVLLSRLEDPEPRVRYEVCKQLKNFNSPYVIQRLIECLQDPSGMVRLAAIESLCHFKAVEALEPLRQLVQVQDPDLVKEATQAIKILTSVV
jgi:HEAT repeat protein